MATINEQVTRYINDNYGSVTAAKRALGIRSSRELRAYIAENYVQRAGTKQYVEQKIRQAERKQAVAAQQAKTAELSKTGETPQFYTTDKPAVTRAEFQRAVVGKTVTATSKPSAVQQTVTTKPQLLATPKSTSQTVTVAVDKEAIRQTEKDLQKQGITNAKEYLDAIRSGVTPVEAKRQEATIQGYYYPFTNKKIPREQSTYDYPSRTEYLQATGRKEDFGRYGGKGVPNIRYEQYARSTLPRREKFTPNILPYKVRLASQALGSPQTTKPSLLQQGVELNAPYAKPLIRASFKGIEQKSPFFKQALRYGEEVFIRSPVRGGGKLYRQSRVENLARSFSSPAGLIRGYVSESPRIAKQGFKTYATQTLKTEGRLARDPDVQAFGIATVAVSAPPLAGGLYGAAGASAAQFALRAPLAFGAGYYGSKFFTEKTPESAVLFGASALGSGIPQKVGGLVFRQTAGRIPFIGKRYVAADRIVKPEVLSGEQRFPYSGLSPKGLLEEFRTGDYLLTKRQYVRASARAREYVRGGGGYHATVTPWERTVMAGSSETQGAYIAPSLSVNFLRLNPRTASYRFSILPELRINRPTIQYYNVDVGRLSPNLRGSMRSANAFFKNPPSSELGKAKISPAYELGKFEDEAIIFKGSQPYKTQKFSKVWDKLTGFKEYTTLEAPSGFGFNEKFYIPIKRFGFRTPRYATSADLYKYNKVANEIAKDVKANRAYNEISTSSAERIIPIESSASTRYTIAPFSSTVIRYRSSVPSTTYYSVPSSSSSAIIPSIPRSSGRSSSTSSLISSMTSSISRSTPSSRVSPSRSSPRYSQSRSSRSSSRSSRSSFSRLYSSSRGYYSQTNRRITKKPFDLPDNEELFGKKYKVTVRRYGKDVLLTKSPVSLKKATKLLTGTLEKSIRASGKILTLSGKTPKIKGLDKRFRQSKVDPSRIVEKRRFRLNTPLELKEIRVRG